MNDVFEVDVDALDDDEDVPLLLLSPEAEDASFPDVDVAASSFSLLPNIFSIPTSRFISSLNFCASENASFTRGSDRSFSRCFLNAFNKSCAFFDVLAAAEDAAADAAASSPFLLPSSPAPFPSLVFEPLLLLSFEDEEEEEETDDEVPNNARPLVVVVVLSLSSKSGEENGDDAIHRPTTSSAIGTKKGRLSEFERFSNAAAAALAAAAAFRDDLRAPAAIIFSFFFLSCDFLSRRQGGLLLLLVRRRL